ncbi:MAG: hypothetical protein ABSG46_08535 [Candidatus Binataceae bacterium]|jgi:hypothetical protein
MKKTIIVASLALIAGAFGGINPARVQAAQAISQVTSNGTLKGSYSFSTLGSYYGYYPGSGILTFDGKGNVTGTMSMTSDYDYVCANMPLVGTYTVYPGYNIASAQLSGTAVSTGACDAANFTLPVAITIGATGSTIYFAEMDNGGDGTYFKEFGTFAAVGNHY